MTRATMTAGLAAMALALMAGCTAVLPPVSNPAPAAMPDPVPVTLPPPAPPKDRLVAAIEQNGCLLTAENAGAILLRANLTQAEVRELVPQLASEGRAEVAASGTIRILSDNCV